MQNLKELKEYLQKHYQVWKVYFEGLDLMVKVQDLAGLVEKHELGSQIQGFLNLVLNFAFDSHNTHIQSDIYDQTLQEINKGQRYRRYSKEELLTDENSFVLDEINNNLSSLHDINEYYWQAPSVY